MYSSKQRAPLNSAVLGEAGFSEKVDITWRYIYEIYIWNIIILNHFKQLSLSSLLSPLPPQVDLGFLRFVSAIGTQGAISQETRRIYFVKSYKVDVSSNGEDWITLKEGSKQKVQRSNPHLSCEKWFISQKRSNSISSLKVIRKSFLKKVKLSGTIKLLATKIINLGCCIIIWIIELFVFLSVFPMTVL